MLAVDTPDTAAAPRRAASNWPDHFSNRNLFIGIDYTPIQDEPAWSLLSKSFVSDVCMQQTPGKKIVAGSRVQLAGILEAMLT